MTIKLLQYYFSDTTAVPTTVPLLTNQCKQAEHMRSCRTGVDGDWCLNGGTLQCRPSSDGRLVWLHRFDNRTQFDSRWNEYEAGFGHPNGNYWLGLNKLHLITRGTRKFKLRVELVSWSGQIITAEYNQLYVASKEQQYRLHVTGLQNDNDILRTNNGRPFTTIDHDNDMLIEHNCAVADADGGGWW